MMNEMDNIVNVINRILVVEDSPTQAEELKYMLECCGYEVGIAKDGKVALQMVDEFKPSIIISDVIMPEMNGYELCKTLKSSAQTKQIPVILVTTLSGSDDLIESLNYSADSFISKPYDKNFLLPHIKKLIETSKLEQKNVPEIELEVSIGSNTRLVKSDPSKMLSMLISTYEAVLSKNKELNRSQENLKTLNENLEDLVDERTNELQKLNAEKDKFFSIIAHDLRGPFNGFLGLTEIMVEELPSLTTNQVKDFALRMKNSATNLYQLLNNLLEWSQIKKGLIPFDPVKIQLCSLIDEVITLALEMAKSKEIEISSDIPEDIMVFADKNILQAVMRNLVSNAMKFTGKGGKVSVSAKITGNKNVEIAIQDNGIGMSHEMLENLFRIDVQTSRKGTEGEPSTGLGLLLCKEFIEKHGGKIWLESEVGKGTVFFFTIP